MSRTEETTGSVANPSQYYLEWDQKSKNFAYYSKEEGERKPFGEKFRFLALKFANSITGYNERSGKGIFSNEVLNTKLEPFRVMERDGAVIANGIYSEIKDQVKSAGGHFTRSIYAITTKGTIVNIKLKGSAMMAFGELEKYGKRWQKEWIGVTAAETKTFTEKDGTVKEYFVPKFEFAGLLSEADIKKADEAYAMVQDYFRYKQQAYAAPAPAAPVPSSAGSNLAPAMVANNDEDDDLPF